MDFVYTHPEADEEVGKTEIRFGRDEKEVHRRLLDQLPGSPFTCDESELPDIVLEGIVQRRHVFRFLRGEPVYRPLNPDLSGVVIERVPPSEYVA